MSVPAQRSPGHVCGRWETIRYALESNARTFRLCLILLVTAMASCLVVVAAALVHYFL